MYKKKSKGPIKDISYKNLAYFSRDSSFLVENFLKDDHNAITGVPSVLNYSDLPNPSLYYKKIFKVVNFGVRGSFWISNGSKWVLENKSVCLALVTSDVVLPAGANNYASLFSYLIPTNGTLSSFRVGDILRQTCVFLKAGTTSTIGRGFSIGGSPNSSNNNSGSYTNNGAVDASVLQLDCSGPSGASNTIYVERHDFQRTGNATFKKNGVAFSTSITGHTSSSIGATVNLATATPAITSFDTSNVYFNTCFATEAVDAGALKFLMLELISYNN